VLHSAPRHEDVGGSGGIAPRILKPGTAGIKVVNFTTPVALTTILNG